MKASRGPGFLPPTVTITPVSSRSTRRPRARAHCSTNAATPSSEPETEGAATRSRRRVISVGEVDTDVGRLLLAADDHRPDAGAGEDLEEEGVGGPAVDDVGAFDATGRGADA